jgi:hypothetical protein
MDRCSLWQKSRPANFVLEASFTPFLAPVCGKNLSKEQKQTNKRIYRAQQIVERSILRLKQYAH